MIPHDISDTHGPSESWGMVLVGERGAALCSLNYSPNISFSRLCFTQASVPSEASPRPLTHGPVQRYILHQPSKKKSTSVRLRADIF